MLSFFWHFPLDRGWLLVKVGRPQWKLGFPPHRSFLTLGFSLQEEKALSVCVPGKRNHNTRASLDVWFEFSSPERETFCRQTIRLSQSLSLCVKLRIQRVTCASSCHLSSKVYNAINTFSRSNKINK